MLHVSLRWLCTAALAALMFTSCGAAPTASRALPTDDAQRTFTAAPTDSATASSFTLAPRQDDDVPFAEIHPKRMITLSGMQVDNDIEFNSGDVERGVDALTADALRGVIRAEVFGESNFGMQFSFGLTRSDDLDFEGTSTNFSYDTETFFLGAAYRALMDDYFRLPVRFGLLRHDSTLEFPDNPLDSIDYALTGVRLSAEPEYVLSMKKAGGHVTSELSVYTELACGAGRLDAEDGDADESGYGFQLSAELGMRLRLASGLLAGVSYFTQKTGYGATDSYNNQTVFFGVDDDIRGFMLTVGYRF